MQSIKSLIPGITEKSDIGRVLKVVEKIHRTTWTTREDLFGQLLNIHCSFNLAEENLERGIISQLLGINQYQMAIQSKPCPLVEWTVLEDGWYSQASAIQSDWKSFINVG